MNYVYSGYLSTILYKPDPAVREKLPAIAFDAEALSRWRTQDLDYAVEWRDIPAKRGATDDGVRLEGDFRNETRIDSLSPNDPRYWVPLSSIDVRESGFPLDVSKHPVVEVTYRCTSPLAHPTWMWTYDGGSHFGALPKSREWITVARLVQHFGFPTTINDLIFRLYSPQRTIESFEIAALRFRALSDTESEALERSYKELESARSENRFPILNSFMPLGVYMDADSAKRLAGMLEISPLEYWDLAMRDLVVHNHNTIVLANVDRLAKDEWRDLLRMAERYGIRFVPRHDFPVGGPSEEQQRILDEHIKPHADSPAILARMLRGEPIENNFHEVLKAKQMIEDGDPNHPVALMARYPNAYPLFAPFFAVSGIGHFTSRRPWDVGKMVQAHVPLSDAQQFWIASPAFTYPTNTPEWSTCPEMRLMFNLGIANGARGWLAYSYHNDPVWLRGRLVRTLTGPFLTFSDLWLELSQRMKLGHALAPLLLAARPEPDVEEWFSASIEQEPVEPIAPNVPPLSIHHLRGNDFSLYVLISNNVRDMCGVNLNLPKDTGDATEIYDLTNYIRTRRWQPMERETHLEMFPGQGQVILVAKPAHCEAWREAIASRLISSDVTRLQVDLGIAAAYGLPCSDLEDTLAKFEPGAGDNGRSPADLESVHALNDQLTNLIYGCADIVEPRTKLIAASSAVCGCDGALCRLMGLGKRDKASALGEEVIPIAREFTALRIELHQGAGPNIRTQCEDLFQRAVRLLERIRAEY